MALDLHTPLNNLASYVYHLERIRDCAEEYVDAKTVIDQEIASGRLVKAVKDSKGYVPSDLSVRERV